jgi:hypothetical protein
MFKSMKRKLLFGCLFLMLGSVTTQAQPDRIYQDNIRGVAFFKQGDPYSMPVLELGSTELLELHFDELGRQPRNYFYTFQLCNADWTPADLTFFEYMRGFTQNRILQYRMSSATTTPYVHYQVNLPEKSCLPFRSGNYLLKVFLNGDTSQLAFTRRMLLVQNQVPIAATALQPFDPALQLTHQKIQVNLDVKSINLFMQQLGKLVILQNNRWETARSPEQPLLIRENRVEFNAELDAVFPAGKEYRWADLRSIRFLSDRIDRIDNTSLPPGVFLKTDADRSKTRYVFFPDLNGHFSIGTTDQFNTWWQTDYMDVHFSLEPNGRQPYAGRDVYIWSDATLLLPRNQYKMSWNEGRGVYEKTLSLKQGYYSYSYVTHRTNDPVFRPDPTWTEGNYFETENEYVILFYYRSFGSRYDELLGFHRLRTGPGLTR